MSKSTIILALAGAIGVVGPQAVFGDTIGLSTGSADYTILSDTNATPDGMSASDVTSFASNWLSTPLTDGIGDTGAWIAPNADQLIQYVNSGVTVYEVTFSLDSNNPTSAILTMNLTGDDFVSVTLNGNTIFSPTVGQEQSHFWTSGVGTFETYGTDGYFSSGVNQLIFTVDNFAGDGGVASGGPTGLDVAASVYVDPPAPLPEPNTFALLGAGCMALVLFRRRLVR